MAMPVFKRPEAEIAYEVHGSGFPLLLFAAGGLRSQLKYWRESPSNPAAAPPWIHPGRGGGRIARTLSPVLELRAQAAGGEEQQGEAGAVHFVRDLGLGTLEHGHRHPPPGWG